MRRLSDRFAALKGWRAHGVSFLSGAVAAAALPPVYALPVLAVSFPALIWQIDGAARGRAAFARGWWFGFGFFVAGLYWIAHALLTDPARYGWMIPFAVGGLAAYLAIYSGLAAFLAHRFGQPGWRRIVIFAVAWIAGEALRGVLFTGFPWNLIGSVWTVSPAMLQVAAILGVYGLGLLTVGIAAAPAALAGSGRGRWLPVAGAAVVMAAVYIGGTVRLAGATADVVPGVMLRLVQPNIAQHHKWRDELRAEQFNKHLRLSATTSSTPPTHIIWAETATPFVVADHEALRRRMAGVVPPNGYLFTGTLRTSRSSSGKFEVWNSLQAIDREARVAMTYDKFHLVPFGEYVPFRSVIGFAKLTAGDTDFSAGPGPRTLSVAGLPPASPLICYEVIFPGEVAPRDERPGWLLNITNDAWFGISSGPHQHFASAQMRAVEEGLPLVRVANTGISGVIDAYGRVRARLGLGREGVVDAPLPVAIADPTPFARWGHTITWIVAFVLFLIGVMARRW
jgi:apolipoprotein N-acyltransferase